jgi:hypothetical protein
MSKEGTNYRNVYKSDHLGVIDLEEMTESGKTLIFTIKEVKQLFGTKVAGKAIDANIAFFNEQIKPLVLNSTNAKVLKQFSKSTHIENWGGLRVELYIDAAVKMKGEVVGGVRIRPTQPKPMEELTPKHPKWTTAQTTTKENGTTIEQIRKVYSISDENYAILCG